MPKNITINATAVMQLLSAIILGLVAYEWNGDKEADAKAEEVLVERLDAQGIAFKEAMDQAVEKIEDLDTRLDLVEIEQAVMKALNGQPPEDG